MRFACLVISGALMLAGCVSTTTAPDAVPVASSKVQPRTTFSGPASTANFATVTRRVEPVAERECRKRTKGINCDFKIQVDDRPDQPANAYQTVDKNGRPLIIFTSELIRRAQNGDELAFVMAHEAAHHMAGHLQRTNTNAMIGAIIFTGLAAASGANATSVQQATETGAMLGSRTFSKNFELEADALGTVIAHQAGFDPVRGAVFFTRIPNPGDRFLGTHPPHEDRIKTVQRIAGSL